MKLVYLFGIIYIKNIDVLIKKWVQFCIIIKVVYRRNKMFFGIVSELFENVVVYR